MVEKRNSSLTAANTSRRKPPAEIVLLASTVIGLFVLLALPLVTWHFAAGYHAEIEEVVVPIGDEADRALNIARQARGVAMSHVYGIDEPRPSPTLTPRQHYESLVREWKQTVRADTGVASLGPSAASQWRLGVAAVGTWLEDYGDVYVSDPGRLTKEFMGQGTLLFTRGIDDITAVRTAAEARQDHLRDAIMRLNRFEAAIVAPLGLISLLIAGLMGRNLLMLRRSRERLSVAVRETNHRVKNNLQVVAALLDMQRMESTDEKTREALAEIMDQVKGMAAVHDVLSKEGDGDEIAVDEMLRKVAELSARSAGLDVTVETAPCSLDAKKATALALVTNELVLNSSKHGAERGFVRLTTNNGEVSLLVEDDGPGFPAGFAPETHANLGLGLVTTLVQHDLRGRIEFPAHGGNSVEIRFPVTQRLPVTR